MWSHKSGVGKWVSPSISSQRKALTPFLALDHFGAYSLLSEQKKDYKVPTLPLMIKSKRAQSPQSGQELFPHILKVIFLKFFISFLSS